MTTTLATTDDVMAVLRGVIDPELGSSIVDLGMVPSVTIGDDGFVRVKVALTTLGCPLQAQILNGLAEVRRDQGSEQLADALEQQAKELREQH